MSDNILPMIMDANWAIVGTCGNCGGPVVTPRIWDTTGTCTGSLRPQHCAYCDKEPKKKGNPLYGPIMEMKP